MNYDISFSKRELNIVKNVFFDYYKHSSNVKYLCDKRISGSICCICLEKIRF